jgi:hypothetical protein
MSKPVSHPDRIIGAAFDPVFDAASNVKVTLKGTLSGVTLFGVTFIGMTLIGISLFGGLFNGVTFVIVLTPAVLTLAGWFFVRVTLARVTLVTVMLVGGVMFVNSEVAAATDFCIIKKIFGHYSRHRLMGSLWDRDKLIPITASE